MSTKNTILSLIAALVIGCVLGRFTLPAKIVTKTITVEVDKKQSNTDTIDHSTTTIVKHKDGSTTVVINKNVDTKTKTKEDDSKSSDTEKTVTYDTSRWYLAGIAVARPLSGQFTPKYGADVSYRILGPFRVGVLGVSDGTLGMSIGIQF